MTQRSASPAKRSKPVVVDVQVPAQAHSYPVIVGGGVRQRLGSELRRLQAGVTRVALISDDQVYPLHGEAVAELLTAEGLAVTPIVIPAGEASKRVEVVVDVAQRLLKAGLGRRDVVVALGGGVVGDLAGLVASLFMRGISVIQCPTSLLAQVDASVGGKVAVDLGDAKNVLGAFHFPLAVFIDPEFLTTLDDRQLASGLAEMLKHGALFSRDHFAGLVAAADAFFARDEAVITPLIAASVGLKPACVSRDPWELREAGKGRVVLNFGHTLGHAIESASDYQLAHGEAVALGMRAAARVAVARGLAERELEDTLVDALERLRLPTALDPWLLGEQGAAVERALAYDKKRSGGQLSYVVLADLAEPSVIGVEVRELFAILRATVAEGSGGSRP